jgi:hypothetical protein
MNEEIVEFIFFVNKRVTCYPKEGGYDVYLSGLLIKTGASPSWIMKLKLLLTES